MSQDKRSLKIANVNTLKINTRTRWRYAYSAIEREGSKEVMEQLLAKKLPKEVALLWALRQREFRLDEINKD